MKHSKKLVLFVSFLILTIFIGGCGIMTKEDNKEEKIKKSFEKTLGMYLSLIHISERAGKADRQ